MKRWIGSMTAASMLLFAACGGDDAHDTSAAETAEAAAAEGAEGQRKQ